MNFTKSKISLAHFIDLSLFTNYLRSTLLSALKLKRETKNLYVFFLISYSILTTQKHLHINIYTSDTHSSSYQSRFLNKSKSSAVVSPTTALTTSAHHSIDDDVSNTGDDSDSIYGTGRTRYLALKERRNRLARSRSSHTMANDDDNDSTHLDEPVSPTTANPNAYLASRCDFVSFVNMYKPEKKENVFFCVTC